MRRTTLPWSRRSSTASGSPVPVHFVDEETDHGPIILQRTVPVLADDTPESLAARVFEAESEALPDALSLLAADRVRMDGRRVIVLSGTEKM